MGGGTSAKNDAQAQDGDESNGDLAMEMDVPQKAARPPQNAPAKPQQTAFTEKTHPARQEDLAEHSSVQPQTQQTPVAQPPALDLSPPEQTATQAKPANKKASAAKTEPEQRSVPARKPETPTKQQKSSKYDQVAQDPTFNYFDKLQSPEQEQKPKFNAVVTQDDDLEGFDLEKFRSANCGTREVKEDMVFAKW